MIYIKKIDNNKNNNHNFARSKLWEALTNPTTKGWDWVKDWFGMKSLGREIGDNNALLNGGIPEDGISESTAKKLLTNKEWAKRVPEALADDADKILKTDKAKILLDKEKNSRLTIKDTKELESLKQSHKNLLALARGIEDGQIDQIDYLDLPKNLKEGVFDKIVEAQGKIKNPGMPDSTNSMWAGTGLNAKNFVHTGDTWWKNATGNAKYAFDAFRATPVGQTVAAPIGAMLRNPAKTLIAGTGYGTYKALSDDTPEESKLPTPESSAPSIDTRYYDDRVKD